MNLAKILTVLQGELLCSNEYRAALLEMFQEHAELSPGEFRAKRAGKARSGDELDVEQATVEGSLAIIPIGGPIGVKLGSFEKGAGAVDVDDIARELAEAENNDEVENIILDFDSPGGMVTGTPELGQKILACEKPVYAFTRGSMCSGAYWLAAACDGIFATPSAQIGNIGVYTTFMDLTGMAEKKGIAVKVISSGPIKGMGVPGTSLSAEQEMFLKGQIMQTAQAFYDHVSSQRPEIAAEDMQGQWYRGGEAMKRGFVDDLFNDMADLKAFLS